MRRGSQARAGDGTISLTLEDLAEGAGAELLDDLESALQNLLSFLQHD